MQPIAAGVAADDEPHIAGRLSVGVAGERVGIVELLGGKFGYGSPLGIVVRYFDGDRSRGLVVGGKGDRNLVLRLRVGVGEHDVLPFGLGFAAPEEGVGVTVDNAVEVVIFVLRYVGRYRGGGAYRGEQARAAQPVGADGQAFVAGILESYVGYGLFADGQLYCAPLFAVDRYLYLDAGRELGGGHVDFLEVAEVDTDIFIRVEGEGVESAQLERGRLGREVHPFPTLEVGDDLNGILFGPCSRHVVAGFPDQVFDKRPQVAVARGHFVVYLVGRCAVPFECADEVGRVVAHAVVELLQREVFLPPFGPRHGAVVFEYVEGGESNRTQGFELGIPAAQVFVDQAVVVVFAVFQGLDVVAGLVEVPQLGAQLGSFGREGRAPEVRFETVVEGNHLVVLDQGVGEAGKAFEGFGRLTIARASHAGKDIFPVLVHVEGVGVPAVIGGAEKSYLRGLGLAHGV